MATQNFVHSHNYQHFEDLQLSAKEFYSMVGTMIKEYEYPGIKLSTIKKREGGLLSAGREYLCIHKDDFDYFVCAAPFGRSFFISWWLQEKSTDLSRFFDKLQRKKEKCFYEIDTTLIFTNAIEAIVKRAVEKVKSQNGIRERVEAI